MGLKSRVIPKGLPGKLKFIRNCFGSTLEEMSKKLEAELGSLGFPEIRIYTGGITEFEKGKREPQLPVLLAYAHLAGVYVDTLINDNLEMPEVLNGMKRRSKLKTEKSTLGK